MMLASFFHSQGMGWYPTYQYYKLQNNLFTAEVTLPNGSSIRGLPGVAKEQAAENAAKAALDFIKQVRGWSLFLSSVRSEKRLFFSIMSGLVLLTTPFHPHRCNGCMDSGMQAQW